MISASNIVVVPWWTERCSRIIVWIYDTTLLWWRLKITFPCHCDTQQDAHHEDCTRVPQTTMLPRALFQTNILCITSEWIEDFHEIRNSHDGVWSSAISVHSKVTAISNIKNGGSMNEWDRTLPPITPNTASSKFDVVTDSQDIFNFRNVNFSDHGSRAV
jgi:hypothetical protein